MRLWVVMPPRAPPLLHPVLCRVASVRDCMQHGVCAALLLLRIGRLSNVNFAQINASNKWECRGTEDLCTGLSTLEGPLAIRLGVQGTCALVGNDGKSQRTDAFLVWARQFSSTSSTRIANSSSSPYGNPIGRRPWSHIGRSSSRSRWISRVDDLIRKGHRKAESIAAASEEDFASAGPAAAAAASFAADAATELEGGRAVSLDCIHPDLKQITPAWNSRRCGVLAYKVGMMSLWDGWGEQHAVTVCQVDRCVVLEQKTLSTHGYEACVLGLGYRSPLRVSRPNLCKFLSLGIEPKAVTAEFKVSSDCLLPPGQELSVLHFVPGQWCFVSGWTIPKGFQGPVKRWGFRGQNASHGTESKAHRSHGSIGQSKTVNVVWKFKKMAGHVGPDPRVVNCQVLRIQADRNLIFLKGCVPGGVGSVLKISDARGKTHHQRNRQIPLPFPTFVPQPSEVYPLVLNRPEKKQDPFAYPEIPIYGKDES
ncbi:50S ribosomal protein L3-2, chloroplastic [Cyclospora cayetanensis]|uniref:Large ribosomal subunit protein uL3m n=1 Tax=Cyclospora cayetanensis TaxID=88456 RepID=A0A6P6RXT9_9EIME|nr:50S ribosomal protein L3-2, chloroplastic [Cyclospora cayetanensis]